MPDNIESNLQRLTAITQALSEHRRETIEQSKAVDEERKASQQRRQKLDEALRNLIRRNDEWRRGNRDP